MHLAKPGLRILGIAESFSGREHSTLAGIVMRKDLRIDGVAFTRITVGGMDATTALTGMVEGLSRKDINCLMISGCVIAWYNIINPDQVHAAINLPVIAVTYEESEGLEEGILRHFPDDHARLEAYRDLGERRALDLHTGYRVFIRCAGISPEDAARLCNDFTRDGKVPELLRVARLAARGVMRVLSYHSSDDPVV